MNGVRREVHQCGYPLTWGQKLNYYLKIITLFKYYLILKILQFIFIYLISIKTAQNRLLFMVYSIKNAIINLSFYCFYCNYQNI